MPTEEEIRAGARAIYDDLDVEAADAGDDVESLRALAEAEAVLSAAEKVREGSCAADSMPSDPVERMVLYSANPVADDGHTDCYYAGMLKAAVGSMSYEYRAVAPGNMTTSWRAWKPQHPTSPPFLFIERRLVGEPERVTEEGR